jgi:hypothetical protein
MIQVAKKHFIVLIANTVLPIVGSVVPIAAALKDAEDIQRARLGKTTGGNQ